AALAFDSNSPSSVLRLDPARRGSPEAEGKIMPRRSSSFLEATAPSHVFMQTLCRYGRCDHFVIKANESVPNCWHGSCTGLGMSRDGATAPPKGIGNKETNHVQSKVGLRACDG